MRVFISWSGEPSRSIARALAGWLESVVQHVDVWMSDEEIGSGQRWSEAITKSLDETDFGIVCVTRRNQHAPWLIFEAGAVAKSVEKGSAVPLCIDLPPTDITGPLEAFQGRSLDKDGVRRLVQDLNEAAEKKMSKERLDGVFNAMWPELEAAIEEAIQGVPAAQEPQRTVDDMVAELVDRVRRIERGVDEFTLGLSPTSSWLTARRLASWYDSTLESLAEGKTNDDYLRRVLLLQLAARSMQEGPADSHDDSQDEDQKP